MPGIDRDQLREQFCFHIQFLGFEVDVTDEIILALYPRKTYFTIQIFPKGALFRTQIRIVGNTPKDRLEFLECINQANKKATLARFYTDKNLNIIMEAWYHGTYQKDDFSRFLELREQDFRTIRQAYNRISSE